MRAPKPVKSYLAHLDPGERAGVMASLSKERGNSYRIHWRFTIRVGPRSGDTIQGSLQLGRCTRAAANARLREIDDWQERVRSGRHVPDRDLEQVAAIWLRDRELTCTPQTLERSKRVIELRSLDARISAQGP